MSDELKNAINLLQARLVDKTKSNNILLIFDNDCQREKYKKVNRNMTSNKILITLKELCFHSIMLVGKRYKSFYFIKEEDIK